MLTIALSRCLALVALLCAAPVFAGPDGPVRVIDGDTFDVGGARVRLHGIDALEVQQTCRTEQGVEWRCGQWVSQQVRALYQGKTARCEALDRDRYDRIVARCRVGGRDVGDVLVSAGLAYAFRKYSMEYDLAEKQAAVADRGIWAHVATRPGQHRAAQRAARPAQSAPAGCAIKGNLSSKGARIYHMPGQEHYAGTRINTAKGERWFCSEAEARAAGWRRARR